MFLATVSASIQTQQQLMLHGWVKNDKHQLLKNVVDYHQLVVQFYVLFYHVMLHCWGKGYCQSMMSVCPSVCMYVGLFMLMVTSTNFKTNSEMVSINV